MSGRGCLDVFGRIKKFLRGRTLVSGAVVIAAGGFASKVLGALYRIPLADVLGGEGMGIYQMVYPLYCILLTVSASGIPAGIARLTASGERGAAESAFGLYAVIGAVGAALMFALARPLALAQGEPAVELCCKLLAPAVPFVSVLAVARGSFQGAGNMTPTAVTEVLEQLIKVLAGTALAIRFRHDTALAAASALFAVTLSEAACSLFAFALYLGARGRRPLYAERKVSRARILGFTLPLTVAAVVMPLSQLAESIAAVNLMRAVTADATALYGIFSGCAVTIINLPVSLTYGIAAAGIPAISPLAAAGDEDGARQTARKCLLLTLAVSVPCAAALFAFAPLAARIIFSSLPPAGSALLVKLVRIMAVNAVTLSLVQTASACLNALGRPAYAAAVQWATCVLRVALTAVFIRYGGMLAEGAAVAANVAYFVAAAFDLWYIIRNGKKPGFVFGLKRRKA